MIRRKTGSIFSSNADTLVNPVNCTGVDGAGLAKEFKERFPTNSNRYRDRCLSNFPLRPGRLHWTVGEIDGNQIEIVNFPTKDDWRSPSKRMYIQAGLFELAGELNCYSARTVALPMLGCGLGGLDIGEVLSLLRQFEMYVPMVTVEVWRPEGW